MVLDEIWSTHKSKITASTTTKESLMASFLSWAKKKLQGVEDTVERNIVNPVQRSVANPGQAVRSVVEDATPVYQKAMPRILDNVRTFSEITNPAYKTINTAIKGANIAAPKIPELPNTNPVNRFINEAGIQQVKATVPRVTSVMQGKNPYQGTGKQIAGQISQDAINMASVVPIGKVAGIAAKTAPVGVKAIQGAKFGAKTGAAFGAAQGASTGLQENKSAPQILKNAAISGVAGGAIGGALGGAVPVAGSAVKGTVRGAQNTARIVKNKGIKAPSALNPSEVADLSNFRQTAGTGAIMDEGIYQRGVAAAQKANIDYRNPTQVDDLLGAHRTFDTQLQQRTEAMQRFKPQKLNEYGAVGSNVPEQAVKTKPEPQVVIPQPEQPVRVAEQPQLPVQAQAQGIVPPQKPPVDFQQPLLGTGKQKATKYASQTIPDSQFVSDPIKGATKQNAPLYTPENEQIRYNQALTSLKKKGDSKFENDLLTNLNGKKGSIGSQDVADAQAYAAKLDVDGNYAKASEIYDKLSEHLTAAGQTVQAAAIMARRSPDGLRRHALLSLKKANVEVTAGMGKQLGELTNAARQAKTQLDKERAAHNIAEFVKTNTPDNVWNKGINFWRAGLLTSPVTTGGNLLANTGEAAIRKAFINPVSTAADIAMSTITGKRTMTLAKPGSATKGFVQGAKTLPEYIKTGFQPGDANVKSKYENSGTINYGNGKLGKLFGGYVNTTYRAMGVADAPYRLSAEKEALTSIAKAEAINNGLVGARQAQFVKEFIANPPKEAAQRAANEGNRATFQNDTLLNDIASGAKSKLDKKSPAAKAVADFVMPFVRTPSAIATRLIERTPIGVGKEIVNQIVNVQNGKPFDQRAMSQAIGNGTFGAATIGAGMALANSGLLTFGIPKDNKERRIWEAEGKQPYSVRVGNRWYSLNYLQPFGTLLAIGGQAHQDIKEGASSGEAATKALATAGQSIQEQSFLKGINGVLSALSDPERESQRYMEQTFSSVTPNFIRAFARATDSVQRQATNIPESVASGIPGLRQKVPEKLDVLGNPLPAKDNFANQYLNPLRPSIARSNPQINELKKLQESGNGVVPTVVKADSFGKETKLSKGQQKALNGEIARAVSAEYDKVIKDPRYASLSPEEKKATLQRVSDVVGGVKKREYAAKNSVGPYAQNAESEPKALTAAQEQYAQGATPDFFGNSKKVAYGASDTEYKQAKSKYEADKKAGRITSVQEIKRSKELAKLEATKDIPKDVRDLYGLSKKDVYAYLTTEEKGVDKAKMAEQLIAMDNTLYDKKITTSKKFKYGIASSSSKGGGKKGRKGGGKKGSGKQDLAKALATFKATSAAIKPPKRPKAPNISVKSNTLPKGYKNTPVKKYAVSKTRVSKKA
jgi:hypothetical protein